MAAGFGAPPFSPPLPEADGAVDSALVHTVDQILKTGAAELSHTVDMYVASDITRVHSTDFIIEDHRVPSWEETVYDWSETTLDSSENWDQVWAAPKDQRENMFQVGQTWLARSGNKLNTIFDDAQNTANGPNGPDDVWFGLGYDVPNAYEDDEDTDWTRDADKRLWVDNDNDVWQLSQFDLTTVRINKLNANGGFAPVTTRSTQVFNVSAYQTTWNCYQDGNELHIVWSDVNRTGGNDYLAFYYSLWNMSTETFTVSNEQIYEPTGIKIGTQPSVYGPAAAIVKRTSDNQPLVLHPHDNVTNGARTGSQVGVSRRTGAATWTTTSWNPVITDSAPNWVQNALWAIEGDSNRCHFLYQVYDNSGTIQLRHRSISSANSWDTDALVVSHDDHLFNAVESSPSYAVTTDSGNSYVTLPVNEYNTTPTTEYRTKLVNFQSGANPTFNTGLAAGTGTNDEYWRYASSDDISYHPGVVFLDADGLLNLHRMEVTFTDGTRAVPDGQGSWIYHEPSKTGYSFANVRGHAGFWQAPGANEQTTDRTEWLYPGSGYNLIGGAYAKYDHLGHFVRSNIHYLYYSSSENLAVPGGGAANVYYIFELPDIPSVQLAHTIDMVLDGTEEQNHTVDMFLTSAGDSTHTVDMRIIELGSESHTVDAYLVERSEATHTTDMVLQDYVDITVNITTTADTISATIDVEGPPPLDGVGVPSGNGGYYSASSGGGAGTGRIRYETGAKMFKRNRKQSGGN